MHKSNIFKLIKKEVYISLTALLFIMLMPSVHFVQSFYKPGSVNCVKKVFKVSISI